MNRKPDVIRVLVIVFAVGLVVSGITSLAASDASSPAVSSSYWQSGQSSSTFLRQH